MSERKLPNSLLLAGVAALALSACAHVPAAQSVAGELPSHWTSPLPEGNAWPTPDWWNGFKSPELISLLKEAQAGSFNVQTAALRVMQAQSQATIAGSNLWPSLSLSGSGRQSASFGNTVFNPNATKPSGSINASLGLNYELDLWGALRANRRAALDNLASSRFNQETVKLDTASGVASGYAQVLSLRDQIKVAQKNIAIAQRLYNLVKARVDAGAVPPLDLSQQAASLAAQQAVLPQLQQQERSALNSLALLLGRPAEGFDVKAQSLDSMSVPSVPFGLPAHLIARRPDVAQAEAQLAGASANVDAARAAFFPSIGISGSASSVSTALATLAKASNAAWTIGASLTQSIFQGGSKIAQFRSARANEKSLLISYRDTVLTAFSETDLAMWQIDTLVHQRKAVDTELASAQEAERLAEITYREGGSDLQPVLSAQTALFQAENSETSIKLQQVQAAIALFRALGGGWERPDATPAQT